VQNSLYVQVLRSRILAALLHGTPAAGLSQTLRLGTRNGITELSQRAPPIFGRAAITLGIGPHSILMFSFYNDFCSHRVLEKAHKFYALSLYSSFLQLAILANLIFG